MNPIKHFKLEHRVLVLILIMVVAFFSVIGYGAWTTVEPVLNP